jgi:cell division protein FtsB
MQEQLEISTSQRECARLEQENKKLRDEMLALQSHDMVPRSQMEAYKKEVNLKVTYCMAVLFGVSNE